jgi:hypothetical protein
VIEDHDRKWLVDPYNETFHGRNLTDSPSIDRSFLLQNITESSELDKEINEIVVYIGCYFFTKIESS